MLYIALRTLRYRAAGFLAALVALAGAAALVASCGVLLETGVRGAITTERYAGAAVIVAGDQDAHAVTHKKGKTKIKSKALAEHVWISDDVADTVRAVPGVRAVLPEVTFPAAVVRDGRPVAGPNGTPSWGHGWRSARLAPFTLRKGRAPRAPDEVVLDAGLADRTDARAGSMVRVRTREGTARYRMVGVASAGPGGHGPSAQAAVFFAGRTARELAGRPGKVAALGVLTDPGADTDTVRARIDRALAGTAAATYTGDDRGSLEFLDASNARVMLISLAGTLIATSLLVAVLVVVGTFALTIQRRHREIALLRAIGATPRQVRKMIGGEALLVGAVASVPGCAASVAVAGWLRGQLVDAGAIPDNLEPALGPVPMLAAVAATMAGAWIAARVASRRVSRVRPTEALTEAAVPTARLGAARAVAGVVFLAGAVVLTIVLSRLTSAPAAMPVTLLTSLVWLMALALLGPMVVRAAGTVLSAPLRGLAPVSGYLAAATTRTDARRLASVLTPISLAVTMACTILFAQTTLGHAARQQRGQGITADYVLRAPAPGLPSAVADAVRGIAGVDAVTEVVHTTVRDRSLGKYSMQGVTPRHLGRSLDLGVRAGSLADLRDDSVALSSTAAARAGVGPGDRLRLWLGDGTPVSPRVVAIYDRGLGFGDITAPRHLVAEHVDNPLDDSVLVTAAPTAKHLRSTLQRRVHDYAGVRVLDGGGVARQPTAQSANARIQYLVMALVIGFATIAVVNTLIVTTAERTREFALLRLVGATRRQIRRTTRWESLVLLVVGTVAATAISLDTLTAFGAGMADTAPYAPPPWYLAIISVAALLTASVTELVTRLALRAHPADALGSPE